MSVMDQETRRATDEIVSWIGRYETGVLALKRETTRRTYTLILQQLLTWLGSQPGHEPPFDPSGDLTQTAVQIYLFDELAGTSISHHERVKSILSSFAEWLINSDCPFVFLSQRARETVRRAGDHPRRLMEGGLHARWRSVKERATRQQWEQIADITFHDLRHDFGHRLRASGFTLEEVAVSLGHVTRKGTPAVATTARYTQPNREQMKHKLKQLSL